MYVICEDCFVSDENGGDVGNNDKEPVVIFAFGFFDDLDSARVFADKMCIKHDKRYYAKELNTNWFALMHPTLY